MTRAFFIVLCLTVAVNTGMGLIVPILPNFLKTYGYSTVGLSLPFISLIIGRILSRSFAPSIIQIFKNKYSLLLCFLIYTVVFFAYSFVKNGEIFIALRFLEGVVEGISIICLSDLAISLSSHNRGKLMGLFGSSFGIGFILGPLIGGFCFKLWGINSIFYAGGILGIIACFLCLCVPYSDKIANKKQTWLNAIRDYSNLLPLYGPSILRRATFFSFMILLPLYSVDFLSLRPDEVANFFTISAIVSASLMPFTGKFSDKVDARKILVPSLLLMGGLIAAFGFTYNIKIFWVLFILETVCFAFMLPSGSKIFADAIHNHESRTNILAGFSVITEVFTLFLAVLLPALYEFNPQSAWILMGLCCVLTAFPFLKIKYINLQQA